MTLDTAYFFPDFFVGDGAQVTLTRHGHLFVGPQAGVGTPGFGSMLRAGWIGGPWGSGGSSSKKIDNFVGQWSITLSGQVALHTIAVGAAETWGNPFGLHHNDFATEAGVGYSTTGAGVTASYSCMVADLSRLIGW